MNRERRKMRHESLLDGVSVDCISSQHLKLASSSRIRRP
jgi:hypothetical protein